jgi:SAM-dependent methyltransferase
MRAQLTPILRCPAGGGPLELRGPGGDWIDEGTLFCPANGRSYPIRAGMPHLYVDDQRWEPKAREAVGWVQFHKDRNIYDQTGVDIDFQLPYFPHEPWIDIARQFDIALELIAPRPGMRVLDVGAGRGWAAKHLALRGCDAVAIEVNPDDQVGLGRANALMAQAGVRFDALIGDSENLPFADESFDVVFAAAALHHTSDLNLLLRNIRRVLRPGGRLVAMNEPCVADSASDEELARSVADELAYGINESHPHLDGYREALGGAGLREDQLHMWQAYGMPLSARELWSSQLGVPPPSSFVPRPNALGRLVGRLLPRPPAEPSAAQQQAWMDSVLRLRGGGIILVASRG